MKTKDIRSKFINYFKEQKHTLVSSASVVPHEDPTLLFNNAGMNQFKDVFLGKSSRDYKRAVSTQKCIRVGGKHNDLENVGHTSRHLTFFEMLGNFSFGDYFKEDAIKFAWELSTEIFGFEEDRIWPSVFENDEEAYELWKKYVPQDRIVHFGEKENFWSMGDVGPCGPCSELLYDRGGKYGDYKNPHEDYKGERFLEFWNLVFMQYNRLDSGELAPLEKKSIDTGAGIERLVALKMGVDNVFETDVLMSIIKKTEETLKVKYESHSKNAAAFHVIADHLRTLSFAIADGAQPSNVDRGYVLRKVLRRAVRYGRTLGVKKPFLAKLLPTLIEEMGDDFREIKIAKSRIEEILTLEEENFMRTLHKGGNLLNQVIETAISKDKKISGKDAFKLKDTYGFPIEEITLIAKDYDLNVDLNQYKALEEEAKERSRMAHKASSQEMSAISFDDYLKTHTKCKFVETLTTESKITSIIVDNTTVEEINESQEGIIILDKTPFYAEKGGQIGDCGLISKDDALFEVSSCQTPYPGIIAHVGKLKNGNLKVNDDIKAETCESRRQNISNNHTATHLLHWALQHVLGEHVKQAGSIVEENRLRFDFNHHKALTKDEIKQIEELVNAQIRKNIEIECYEIEYSKAQKDPTIKQFFGDKYDSKVRVIDIGESKELCGGIHASHTGNIGYFRITKEGSIAAGIRRIDAVSGIEAEKWAAKIEESLDSIAAELKTTTEKLPVRIDQLLNENKELSAEIKKLKNSLLKDLSSALVKKAKKIGKVNLIAEQVDMEAKELRPFAKMVSDKIKDSIILLASKSGDKCHLLLNVSKGLQFSAKELIKELSTIIKGGGGGNEETAQAAGSAIEKITDVLKKIEELVNDRGNI